MKIALHNFFTTLRRYKASSLLNVIGLTLAFTAFYVILVQVRWELTFNRAIPDADRICLVAPFSRFSETDYSFNSPRPEGEQLIARSPEIEAGGCRAGNSLSGSAGAAICSASTSGSTRCRRASSRPWGCGPPRAISGP